MKVLVVKSQTFEKDAQAWQPEELVCTYLCQTEKEVVEKITSERPYYPDTTRYTYYTYDIVPVSQVEWVTEIRQVKK